MSIFAEFIKLLSSKNFSGIVIAVLLQLFLSLSFSSSAATAALTDYFRESWNTR